MVVTDNSVKSINTVLLALQNEIASLKKQLEATGDKTETIQKQTNYNKQQSSTNNDDYKGLADRVFLIDANAASTFNDNQSTEFKPFNGVDVSFLVDLYNNKVDRYGYNDNGMTEFADNLVRTGKANSMDGETFPSGACSVVNGAHNAVALGKNTEADQSNTVVIGKYNVPDDEERSDTTQYHAFIIGNGTDTTEDKQSNALAVDWNGDVRANGNIYIGCEADSTGGKKLTPLTAKVSGKTLILSTTGD